VLPGLLCALAQPGVRQYSSSCTDALFQRNTSAFAVVPGSQKTAARQRWEATMNWKVLSDHVPLHAKAIAAAQWHQCAILRQAASVREYRPRHDSARAHEGYWIVLEACLAHLEGRTLTQKDLTAQASGTASAATVSRTIQGLEVRGILNVRVCEADARVRIIEPSARALDIFMSRVESSWQAFWSIAERALRAAEDEVRMTSSR
jgi:DNA-binding MarR family transcriptional regulator